MILEEELPKPIPRLMRHHKKNLRDGLADLITWINSPDSLLVEIGSWTGESTEIFAKAFRKVVSVEPHLWNTAKYFDLRCAHITNIEHLKLTGSIAVKKFGTQTVDVVYIDGDHSYDAVKSDIISWLPIIVDGGVICGHDYLLNKNLWGIPKAVDELFGKPDKIFQDTSWAVRVNMQQSPYTIQVI